MKNFEYWNKLFQSQKLEEFSQDKTGILWLKVKSIVRKEIIKKFLAINKIEIKETSLAKQFVELFNLLCINITNSNYKLDEFIKTEYNKQIDDFDTKQMVSELYLLKSFKWGGDYQNSLDKYLVNNYVKNHKSYNVLISKFDTEINVVVQGYVLNSWYNHWSSIIIENIFKSHHAVLPTVGLIKGVDFFINNIPFDLKVTYMPEEFLKLKRKEKGLPIEITYLKKKAKEANLYFNKNASQTDIYYEIIEKMKDRNDDFCLKVLNDLKNEKLEILKEAQLNPKILAKWLYENQGEMRFGSENRLFLVLIDTENFTDSWKLKRNIDLLKPKIIKYLDNFKNIKIEDLKLNFEFKDKPQKFTTFTDIIFILK